MENTTCKDKEREVTRLGYYVSKLEEQFPLIPRDVLDRVTRIGLNRMAYYVAHGAEIQLKDSNFADPWERFTFKIYTPEYHRPVYNNTIAEKSKAIKNKIKKDNGLKNKS